MVCLEVIAQFQNVPICIVGDLNEDVLITSNTHCCTMFKLQGLQQMIKTPTHDSGTIIDQFICITHAQYITNRCYRLLLQ